MVIKRVELVQWLVVILGLVLMYKYVNKHTMIGLIEESLPPREAVLMKGMILGETNDFSKKFYEELKNSGLVHLVVVSGSNVMLLTGGVIEMLAGWLGRKKTIALGIGLAWGYVGLVGWQIPVVRAVLMVSLWYGAQLIGRKYDVWRGLIAVIIIMAAGDFEVFERVSFWLSITAFLGVLTAGKGGIIKQSMWVGVWISPITMAVFGKINLIGPIANWLVVMVTEMITVLGMIGVTIGLIWPVLGKIIIELSWPMLKYLGATAELLGSGWGVLGGIKFNVWMAAGSYLLLAYGVMKRRNVKV